MPDCNRPPARIDARGNLVLWVSAEDRYDETAISLGTVFWSLDDRLLPSDRHGSVIMPPVDGDPLGSGTFLAQLHQLGLSYTPYESFYRDPIEGGSRYSCSHLGSSMGSTTASSYECPRRSPPSKPNGDLKLVVPPGS